MFTTDCAVRMEGSLASSRRKYRCGEELEENGSGGMRQEKEGERESLLGWMRKEHWKVEGGKETSRDTSTEGGEEEGAMEKKGRGSIKLIF
jgi:hypothetical protein